MKDHLGNVRSIISDRLTATLDNGGQVVNDAEALAYNNYYPFGMLQPGRNQNTGDYRFGFNGKEMDNEISGTGNSYDYGFRIYNPRIGKWLSIDPLRKKYPSLSPFQFAGNNPIFFIDPDGRVIIDYKTSFLGYVYYPKFIKSHGEIFERKITSLKKYSNIFNKVYGQLENSNNYFMFKENQTAIGGVAGAMTRNNLDAGGAFQPKHNGTEDDPYIVGLNYNSIEGIHGYGNPMVIFEEVFHAGQTDFYKSNKPCKMDIEVEAKVVGALEGINNEFTYEGFDEFKTTFKKGTTTEAQLETFEIQSYFFAKKTSELYIKYHIEQGMSKEDAKRIYGMQDFKGDFKYAKHLYGKDMRAKSNIIVTGKKREK